MPSLQAWAESLGGISYPLLSDFYPHGAAARSFGVLRPDGRSERAIFIIDPDGSIRFSKVYPIDELPDNEEVFAALEEITPGTAPRPLPQPQPLPQPSSETISDVILYCTRWCPDCRKARQFLTRRNIPFLEVDLNRDRAAAERVRQWGNGKQITPTFDINGKIVVDYREADLLEALGLEE